MQGMNPNTGLMPEAKNIFKDSDVKYIKISKGGRPIRLWVNEWNSIAERHELKARIETTEFYQPILTEYSKMIKDFGKPKSITFCWMQGERDAKENLSLAYEDALNQLIKNLRRDLKRPDMSFVIGRISDHIKESHKSWTGVRKAQVKVSKDDPLGAWVDCDDLNNMTDEFNTMTQGNNSNTPNTKANKCVGNNQDNIHSAIVSKYSGKKACDKAGNAPCPETS